MKILHYALGFPPYRSGGLTKYCIDLMQAQKDKGHEVMMMWPGKMSLTGHFVRFKRSKNHQLVNHQYTSFESIEMVNPLPVPLDEGVLEVDKFMEPCANPEAFEDFLLEEEPDVIHIHTLMGLYPEMLIFAKELGIKIIFTTHDFYGICPKVTLFREGAICNGDCGKCASCNKGALTMSKIKLLQSSAYRKLKDSSMLRSLRKKHRDDFFEEDAKAQAEDYSDKGLELEDMSEDIYETLRDFYRHFFDFVDVVHFNSTLTKDVYRRYLPMDVKGKVINLSHAGIEDSRRLKKFGPKLKITFLGTANELKGFNILKEALDELWKEGTRDFELIMYYEPQSISGYMRIYERYTYAQLEEVFDDTDVLVAPSVGYDTYGFTVLEALSYGVPVMVSTNVGAKDLLQDGSLGMIIKPTKEDIKQAVLYIIKNRELLEYYNKKIFREFKMKAVMNSAEEIEKLYQ